MGIAVQGIPAVHSMVNVRHPVFVLLMLDRPQMDSEFQISTANPFEMQ